METRSLQQFLNSYSVKMILAAVLAIVLLIPSFLIQDIIHERIALNDKVKQELYQQWGAKQGVAGPVLNIPYSVITPGSDGQPAGERRGVAHFLPDTWKAGGELIPSTRKRGIYKVVVYEGRIALQGTFLPPDLSKLDLPGARFDWSAAYFTVGVTDMRGIRNLPELVVNGRRCSVDPGVADTDLFASGITVKGTGVEPGQPVNFAMELVLNGSEQLMVEPLGKTSEVTLRSAWTEPGFTGAFLPATRTVTGKGFTAAWRVTHLNRNFPQQWADRKYVTHESALGAELLLPVDHYQKSMRSVKYAILFIALNFIVFLFIEIRSRTRIHLFQYVLVAFALLIFYALLTSLGEQIGFNPAYLVSAAAVTLLITWYAFSLLRNLRLAGWVALLQVALYAFLFTILQLQDYALLAGSVGLFVILALVMRASQQIKWDSGG